MDLITDLIIQKRNKSKVNVSLNNKFYCVLSLETIVKNNLKKGSVITQSKLEQLQGENEEVEAFNQTLNLINKRFKTKHEIIEYLKSKGYLNKVIFSVIEKLTQYNYIDDERYCESYLNHHKNKGKNLLKQELFYKGVSESVIDNALSNLTDQSENIKLLVDKYMKNRENNKENYVKLVRYLLGKGFTYEEILKVLKKEVEE